MNIEIIGVGFHNKGAELMLRAVAQHFAQSHPEIALVGDRFVGGPQQIGRYGLLQKLDSTFLGRSGMLFDRLAPQAVRNLYGLVREDEIDAVLDASGFLYGDQWPQERIEERARRFVQWKRQGKQIVLLAQAFGPFENQPIRDDMRRILAAADLVFARDKQSYEHVANLDVDTAHVHLAPDYTNLVEGVVASDLARPGPAACLMPSRKMLDETSPEVSGRYLGFLATCAQWLEQRGMAPFVLLHASEDRQLPEMLEREKGIKLEVVFEDDPARAKGILGGCTVVIGSRFHGLVSALSQGVPCLAAGWSHKYQGLLDDYGCPELLIDPRAATEEVETCLKATCDEPQRATLVQRLRDAAAGQKESARQMWRRVDELLGNL